MRAWPISLAALCLIPAAALAVPNSTCERCHSDAGMHKAHEGIEHSLNVTSADLTGTPHDGMECTDCHTDLARAAFPHPKNLELPNCGACHEEAQQKFIDGFFKPLREKGYTSVPRCVDCHGTHKITRRGNPLKVCGVCHQDMVSDFTHSAHWKADQAQDPAVSCVSCHSPHFKKERESMPTAEWRVKVTERCRACHEQEVEDYDHSGHFVKLKQGNLQTPSCPDCHSRHKVLSPRNPESQVSVARLDKLCTSCHASYEKSVHRPRKGDDPRLETCTVCHTGHSTEMGQAKSPLFKEELARTCLRCHETTLVTRDDFAHGKIHRVQLEKLRTEGQAECGSCHAYHFQVPGHVEKHGRRKACGDCHTKEKAAYDRSVHAVALAKGHEEAPDCGGCHGESNLRKPEVGLRGESVVKICGRCHDDRGMTMKFQINPDVVRGYATSYHGQMYQLGYQGEKFATCVSCHDNHTILRPDDPASTVNRENIKATCGKCHKNVNENFVGYLQHYSPMAKEKNPVLVFINVFMKWLLGVTLAVFGGHTLLWFIRLAVRRVREGPLRKHAAGGLQVRRFRRSARWFHLVMVLSFLTLAATGLPLKYSYTAFANWFVNHIVGFGAASLLHRLAAFTLIGLFLGHLGYLAWRVLARREKGLLWGAHSLVPSFQDARDFIAHTAYFLGLRKQAPPFGHWTYWEKFDYFAVFWGVVVIGISGLTLMFPETFTRLAPGWFINAAHIIHSEEALLATAFIFTVHFFNTHLRPGVFPMDEVIFTGSMDQEHFAEERALERQALTDDQFKALLVAGPSARRRRISRFGGFVFLSIGMLLLVLIVVGTFAE
jgi:cytochrome b subunit of formate dehydrogenase